MSSVPHQQFAAFPQRSRQIKSIHAATRSTPLGAVAAKNYRRAIKLLQHARCHDSHDPDVPLQIALHDREVSRRVELIANLRDDTLSNTPLDRLPFTIVRVEPSGYRARCGH